MVVVDVNFIIMIIIFSEGDCCSIGRFSEAGLLE